MRDRVWRGCCCVCVEKRSDEDDIRLSPLPRRSPWRRQRTCLTAGAARSPLSTAGAAGLYWFSMFRFFCIFNLYCIVVVFNLTCRDWWLPLANLHLNFDFLDLTGTHWGALRGRFVGHVPPLQLWQLVLTACLVATAVVLIAAGPWTLLYSKVKECSETMEGR